MSFVSSLFKHQSSIWPIDRTLSGATIPSQSGPGSNINEGVFYILQSSKTRVLPSDGLMSSPGQSLQKFYPSAEMQLMYSTASTDCAEQKRDCVSTSVCMFA